MRGISTAMGSECLSGSGYMSLMCGSWQGTVHTPVPSGKALISMWYNHEASHRHWGSHLHGSLRAVFTTLLALQLRQNKLFFKNMEVIGRCKNSSGSMQGSQLMGKRLRSIEEEVGHKSKHLSQRLPSFHQMLSCVLPPCEGIWF